MDNIIERGLVLGVNRGIYQHYGVYVGDDQIVHFTSLDNDISGDSSIMKTPMKHFLRKSKEFFVLKFPDEPEMTLSKNSYLAGVNPVGRILANRFLSQISGEDIFTGYRARSKIKCASRAEDLIGKDGYNHFVKSG